MYPPTPSDTFLTNDRVIDRVQAYDNGNIDDYERMPQSEKPFRPAVYFLRMDGMHDWQTWANLEYPPEYQLNLAQNGVTRSMQISVLNNMPEPIQFAPIAIQEYALNTQMVYTGGQGEV